MAHELDTTRGTAAIAFAGSRDDIWHRLGAEMQPGQSIAEWQSAAGLDWHALRSPAFAQSPDGTMVPMPGRFLTRSDTGGHLGYVSESYKPVQPGDVLAWFGDYILTDSRFQLDVAGALRGGAMIWATARFTGDHGDDFRVAGERHTARVLMSTSFDTTSATICQGTLTRVVCANTARAAHADKRAVVRVSHSTKFDPARAASELATIAQSFETFRAMGEALAQSAMPPSDVSAFFKALLEIPFDAARSDISPRKYNQFQSLSRAYGQTVHEGTEAGTAWTAFNAVTRYVDHDRGTRGDEAAQFTSANFGSGDSLKAQAAELLAKYDGTPANGVAVPAGMAALVA